MKTFCVGDIHGAYKALVQCLKLSGFDYGQDRLIVLGDICDGYPEVNLCIEELLKIKHCDYIFGNHDLWALDWALRNKKPDIWLEQGGQATIASYGSQGMSKFHVDFLLSGVYWLELENKIFVHGGFNPKRPLEEQDKEEFVWNRDLILNAYKQSLIDDSYQFGTYDEIFVGHTPTKNFQSQLPVHVCNVWDLDTGAGRYGALTMMDIHTKQYWQSEATSKLYEGIQSR
ncbi:MAG: metallophosphoesterase [Candidatus Omnitrophica bacterium]|nr:metallophosphoesterase [Candidatus Omnitrophota bacterium]